MAMIPDKAIDMILCDLPYAITSCRWDSLIPFDMLWRQYARIIKDNGAIVLTASQPFTTELIGSNRKLFRYCWYWVKNQTTGFPFAKFQPMRKVEDVCVFYKKMPTYNPQGLIKIDNPKPRQKNLKNDFIYKSDTLSSCYISKYTNYPNNVLEIKCERGLHPTQKPVELFTYLIRTYTNEGELVLDNCMGSGTTAEACILTRRNYIGYEIETQYWETATKRAEEAKQNVGRILSN